MPIFRFHFGEGVPLPQSYDNLRQALKAVVEQYPEAMTELLEGEYNLTPEWWTKHWYSHHLLVITPEQAIYTATPRRRDKPLPHMTEDGRIVPYNPRTGVQIIAIPGDQDIVAVGGPLNDQVTMGVYEIIIHIPEG